MCAVLSIFFHYSTNDSLFLKYLGLSPHFDILIHPGTRLMWGIDACIHKKILFLELVLFL